MKGRHVLTGSILGILTLIGLVNAQQAAPQFEGILAHYDFPVIGRNFAIALFMLGHVIFPNLNIGGPLIGLISEIIAIKKKSPEWDRFAKSAVKLGVVMFSIGSTFAVAGVVLFAWFFPNFWILGLNIFGWPLAIEGITFFLAIAFLYSWFYTWDRWHNRRGLHLLFGALAVWFAHQAMLLIVGVAAIMLTVPAEIVPVVQGIIKGELANLPALGAIQSLALLYPTNPTYFPQLFHRVLANISVAGIILAGIYAFMYLRHSNQRKFFDFAVSRALAFGIIPIILQPLVGWWYVERIKAYQMQYGKAIPGIYEALTGVKESTYMPFTTAMVTKQWMIYFVVLLIAVIWLLFGIYAYSKIRDKNTARAMLGLQVLAFLLLAWKKSGMTEDYLAFLLLGISGVVLFAKLRHDLDTLPAFNTGMYAVMGIQVLTIILVYTMGFVRETARAPWLVPGLIRIQDLAPGGVLKDTAYTEPASTVIGVIILTMVVFYIFLTMGIYLTNFPKVSTPMATATDGGREE